MAKGSQKENNKESARAEAFLITKYLLIQSQRSNAENLTDIFSK
jgi:hypothetical protein